MLRKFTTMANIDVATINKIKSFIPALTTSNRKGNHGRIAVIGGCFEYTGAPYFAAISALKVGADLVHVFCTPDSAQVIKSYSPELIVHPLLNTQSISEVLGWLERMHVVVIGPGLGRNAAVQKEIHSIIDGCAILKLPIILDADGIYAIQSEKELLKKLPLAILTPNAIEFARFFNETEPPLNVDLDKYRSKISDNLVIVRKDTTDVIFDQKIVIKCSSEGSGRRCGGQGDLLSGSLATFLCWALSDKLKTTETTWTERGVTAAYAACVLTRECNRLAFSERGRSMTCSDMIGKIGVGFGRLFEVDNL